MAEFAGIEFRFVETIKPERDAMGTVRNYAPQEGYDNVKALPLHAYGGGPFCKFRVAKGIHESGCYVLTRDGTPVYAGKCVSLDKRWGANGYGSISPRNCFSGGQSTNCRINTLVLKAALLGNLLELWFLQIDESAAKIDQMERQIISVLKPIWNKALMT